MNTFAPAGRDSTVKGAAPGVPGVPGVLGPGVDVGFVGPRVPVAFGSRDRRGALRGETGRHRVRSLRRRDRHQALVGDVAVPDDAHAVRATRQVADRDRGPAVFAAVHEHAGAERRRTHKQAADNRWRGGLRSGCFKVRLKPDPTIVGCGICCVMRDPVRWIRLPDP